MKPIILFGGIARRAARHSSDRSAPIPGSSRQASAGEALAAAGAGRPG